MNTKAARQGYLGASRWQPGTSPDPREAGLKSAQSPREAANYRPLSRPKKLHPVTPLDQLGRNRGISNSQVVFDEEALGILSKLKNNFLEKEDNEQQ